MLRTLGPTQVTDSFVELSFRQTATWPFHYGPMAFTGVVAGDDVTGPMMMLSTVPTEVDLPEGPAHAHASDNFRIELKGEFSMGREHYTAGHFRLQEGWRPYPEEYGPGGRWSLTMMADRRGFRRRLVKPFEPGSDEEREEIAIHRAVGSVLKVGGDIMFPDDPDDTAGPTAIASSLGRMGNAGKLNGSFDDLDDWTQVDADNKVAVTLFGHVVSGPILVLTVTEPFAVQAGRCRFDTEVFRMVVRGSCEIDGQRHELGDVRVDRAGASWGPVVAGPEGYQEVQVIADRRGAPDTETGDWALAGIVNALRADLASRPELAGLVASG